MKEQSFMLKHFLKKHDGKGVVIQVGNVKESLISHMVKRQKVGLPLISIRCDDKMGSAFTPKKDL